MEDIIKWMTQRIKDEHRKHSAHNENWAEIAARKLFATYEITLRKPVVSGQVCPICKKGKIVEKLRYNECDNCGTLS